MGLIVYDMGRRIETPAPQKHRRINRATASSKTAAIQQHTNSTQPGSQGIEGYQTQLPQHTPKPVSYLKDIMSRNIITLSEDAIVADAWEIFLDSGFHHIPIISPNKDVLAIVSKSNLSQGPEANRDITQQNIMKFAKTDIRQATRILYDYNLGALPIVDKENKLIGIVTRTDIIRLISHYGPMELWA
jgi:CBS domain-containing protein